LWPGLTNYQRLALRWIHENIASFGGDSSKVTIMGESAGTMSVSMQLLSEPSTNLFRAGIMESGAATAAYRTAAEVQPSFDNLVKLAGCSENANVLDCVRNVDLATFIKATNGTGAGWFPTVDGVFLTDRLSKLMKAGKMAKVNILIGRNFFSYSLATMVAHLSSFREHR
jgi:acetylcholinesterase